MNPSGSFAKGTALRGGTDIDIFLSLSDVVTDPLQQIYESLFNRLRDDGFSPRRQNVSIGTTIGAFSVDIVPARRHDKTTQYHSLWRNRAGTWTQTNVDTHISAVSNSGRLEEILILKAWRNQKGLRFPSFFLELVVIEACKGRKFGELGDNVWAVLAYIADNIGTATFIDPANTNNRISDDLTAIEKSSLAAAARLARQARQWNEIVA